MLIFICTHFMEQNYMEVYETSGMGISGVSKKEKKSLSQCSPYNWELDFGR